MKKILFLAFANCLALLGCMKDNTSPENTDTVGMAQIRFPTVPEAALKAAAKTATSPTNIMPAIEPYIFTITISGQGMSTRTQTWNASDVSGKTVTLENIPAGPGRLFKGMLTRNNFTTHEGSYTVDIGGGQSVFVPLVLRDVRNGRAEICVEVEGWPGSPNCVPIDTLPEDTLDINGCWKFGAYTKDSVHTGILSLSQYGQYLSGSFQDSSGRYFQVLGNYRNHAWELTLEEPRYVINYMKPYVDTSRKEIMPAWPPVDTTAWPLPLPWPVIYVKVETVARDTYFGPTPFFKGEVMDAKFQTRLGDATGTVVGCKSDTTMYPHPDPDTLVYIDDSLKVIQLPAR